MVKMALRTPEAVAALADQTPEAATAVPASSS
jgi:hypothetical protein